MFSWFSKFLQDLSCCLHIWSSHLHQSVVTDWLWEQNTSVSQLSSEGEILQIVRLLLILHSQAVCWQPPVCFPWNSVQCSHLCAFSHAHRVHLHVLNSHLQRLALTAHRACAESQLQGGDLWVKYMGHWGVWGPVGRLPNQVPEALKRIHIPLIPSKNSCLLFPSSSASPSCTA